jgi:hypothetical protein
MYHENQSARLEREIEELFATGPFSKVYPQVVNSTPDFDIDLVSKEHGHTIGTCIALSATSESAEMVKVIKVMLGDDPQLDDQVVALVRGMCVDIRHHLTNDTIARELARRIAHHATSTARSIHAKNPGKRPG